MKVTTFAGRLALVVAGLALLPLAAFAAEEPIDIEYSSDMIEWFPNTDWKLGHLTITGPGCLNVQYEFHRGERIVFKPYDVEGNALPNGTYSFDLQLGPGAEVRGLEEDYGQSQICRGRLDLPPLSVLTSSGYVSVINGKFVDPFKLEDPRLAEDGLAAEGPESAGSDGGEPIALGSPGMVLAGEGFDEPRSMAAAATVISGDLTVYNSICVGFDCPTSPSFGADTIRLQENNLRIHFDDTSTATGFPNRDWRIVANDQASGGANKFSIDDVTGSRTPFTIEGNAPSHSLYVDDGGRVGFGTSTPVTELHVKDGDTPTLRLEQDTSSGFAAQTWDVAGNETNFFVRDATNGSTLPFRIQPGASSSSVFIANDSDVGFGTSSPLGGSNERGIHVLKTGATSEVLLKLESNGPTTRFMIENQNDATCAAGSNCSWSIGMRQNSSLVFIRDGSGGDACTLTTAGNFSCIGTVGSSSSREVKSDIVPVDPREMLARVVALPIAEWTYNHEAADGVRHVSPIAEDFYATFGLGFDDKHLAPMDTSGVALAAIQGLNELVSAKDAEIDELRADNERKDQMLEDLARRLARLEALLP